MRRQFAVEQQVGDFHEARLLGQLADRIAAVEQDAFVAVDIGQRAFAARGRGEAGIVGEHAGLAVELADVDDVGADAAFQHGIVHSRCRRLRVSPVSANSRLLSITSVLPRFGRLRVDPRQAFFPSEQDQHVENPGRGRLPRQRRAQRLRELAEAQPQLLRIGLQIGLERFACPVVLPRQARREICAKQRPCVVGQQRLRPFRQSPAGGLEQERRAVGQFVEVAGARS